MDVHHGGGAETILGGQRAGDEPESLRKTRAQLGTEARDAFRQQDVVDAILQVGMFAADMHLPERILRYAPGVRSNTSLNGAFSP